MSDTGAPLFLPLLEPFQSQPEVPINQAMELINAASGGAGGSGIVESIVAGANVSVDSTDPANPIVSASGGGGGDDACVWNRFTGSNADTPIVTDSGVTILSTKAGISGSYKATVAKNSGKKYWEATVNAVGAAGTPTLGMMQMAASGQVGDGSSVTTARTGSWGLLANSGDKYHGSTGSYGSALSAGNVVMIAVDFAAQKLWMGKNGTWFASGDPAAGSNEAYSDLADWLFPAVTVSDGASVTANFGASAFAYTPPSGFVAWDS